MIYIIVVQNKVHIIVVQINVVTVFNPYRLNYSLINEYSDAMDVIITVANFANTSSVEFLDLGTSEPQFFGLVEYFVQRGYSRDVNIRAAPYDYRLSTGIWRTCDYIHIAAAMSNRSIASLLLFWHHKSYHIIFHVTLKLGGDCLRA